MKALLIILTIVFGVSSTRAILNGKNILNEQLLIFIVMSIITICYFVYRNNNKVFDLWLSENKEVIIDNGLIYNDLMITKETKLSRYSIILSYVSGTHTISSRLYIEGDENHRFIGVIYAMLSAIFGWWAIPLGLIMTVQSIVTNIAGGEKLTVSDYFNPNEQEAFNLFTRSGAVLIAFIIIIVLYLAHITSKLYV